MIPKLSSTKFQFENAGIFMGKTLADVFDYDDKPNRSYKLRPGVEVIGYRPAIETDCRPHPTDISLLVFDGLDEYWLHVSPLIFKCLDDDLTKEFVLVPIEPVVGKIFEPCNICKTYANKINGIPSPTYFNPYSLTCKYCDSSIDVSCKDGKIIAVVGKPNPASGLTSVIKANNSKMVDVLIKNHGCIKNDFKDE